jgi:sugar phosphate isomerase/epimerase
VREGIDQAADLNAERVGILSGPAPTDETKREEQLNLLERSIRELCTYADQRGGLGITLETFDPSTDKRSLVGSSHGEAAELARSIRADGHDFGIMIDLSHLPMQSLEPPYTTPRGEMEALGETLVHAHVGSCVVDDREHPAYGDTHPRFGVGEIDVPELAEFLDALFDVGYLGGADRPIVSFEVSPAMGEDPEIVVANAKRTFQRAWARLDR